MSIPTRLFDLANPMSSASSLFNTACQGSPCVPEAEIDLGSTAIDYESDPSNPIFHRLVLHGGRGWSIFEVPQDPSDLLRLVYDSADTVEKLGCEKFPWAHNAAQNEEFGPAGNLPNSTFFYNFADEETKEVLREMNDPAIDGCEDQGDGMPGACPLSELMDGESNKRGVEINIATIGFACGRLVTAVAGEGNSVSVIYDITDITNPTVFEVIHLSPSSETKSPGIAFNDGTVGEIDTVDILFMSASQSPTGKASLMYVGQSSGTVSLWTFECVEPDDPNIDWTTGEEVDSIKSGVLRRQTEGIIVVALLAALSYLF
mmetsp:Transcript_10619/g.21707  ORF Transcript_10619/g.21707 Transcript_10619/m.21707 type:complete len:317 (+) Transcript_10619:142-1092(+)